MPPEDILAELKPHIDEIIVNAEADPNFRFTIEDTWHVLEWRKRTDNKELIESFARLVRSGQIQVSMSFGSMHSEFMSAEALNRIAYDWTKLSKELNIDSDFAMMNDVPGFVTRLPQILAKSGVRYFVNGSNLGLGMGGGTSLYPGTMPFYWESPDGSKVLMWQTQGARGGYTEGIADYWLDPRSKDPYHDTHFYPEEFNGMTNLEIMLKGMDKLKTKYAEAGYPYDAVMIIHSHDFVTSDWARDNLMPSVDEWNEAGYSPRIQVATPKDFFDHIETKYGRDFPVYQGDWTGLWSEAKINSPGISATARWCYNHLIAAENLWTVLDIQHGDYHPALQPALENPDLGEWYRTWKYYPIGNIWEAYYKLNKYAEHSGSGQTGWPGLTSKNQINRQNEQYVDYVSSTRSDVQALIQQGLLVLGNDTVEVAAEGQQLLVFNPLSWDRTDVVRVVAPPGQEISVTDSEGHAVAVQRSTESSFEFIAVEVPSLGYKSYRIEYHPQVKGSNPIGVEGDYRMENAQYQIEIRELDGVISSIVDKNSGKEIVNQSASKGWNELMRWTLLYEQPMALGKAEITVDSGPVSQRIIVKRPGSMWPETWINLYHALPRIEMSNQLDRSKMPFVAQTGLADYYSILFPFNYSETPQIRIENGAGFHRWPEEYLPGARLDAAVPQHVLSFHGNNNGTFIQVDLGMKESFFNHLPAWPADGTRVLHENTVRASIMRKFDQGVTSDMGAMNFPTVEPGLDFEDWYSYAVSAQATTSFDAVTASRMGWEFNLPLQTVILPPNTRTYSSEGSFLSLDADNVEILAFKPEESGERGYYIIRLQEISGDSTKVTVTTPFTIHEAERVTLTEDIQLSSLSYDPLMVEMGPYETCTIRLKLTK